MNKNNSKTPHKILNEYEKIWIINGIYKSITIVNLKTCKSVWFNACAVHLSMYLKYKSKLFNIFYYVLMLEIKINKIVKYNAVQQRNIIKAWIIVKIMNYSNATDTISAVLIETNLNNSNSSGSRNCNATYFSSVDVTHQGPISKQKIQNVFQF